MATDFPNSPEIGDQFTVGTQTREWNGATWDLVPTITAGPAGPTGPTGAGATGPQGPQGATGATGQGLTTGGATGTVLHKNSATDYDTAWTSNVTVKDDANISYFDVSRDGFFATSFVDVSATDYAQQTVGDASSFINHTVYATNVSTVLNHATSTGLVELSADANETILQGTSSSYIARIKADGLNDFSELYLAEPTQTDYINFVAYPGGSSFSMYGAGNAISAIVDGTNDAIINLTGTNPEYRINGVAIGTQVPDDADNILAVQVFS